MSKSKDPWSHHTIVESDTGKTYNKYFYKGKPAYRVIVNTPTAKTLAGYVLIEKDLRSSIFWLKSILEAMEGEKTWVESKIHYTANYDRDKFNLVKALFVAALTFYGKAFTQCRGRKIKLDQSNLGEEFQDDHEFAMEFRHNFAAHSGAKRLEFAEVVIALDKKKKALPCFSYELVQPDVVSHDDIIDLVNLFEHAKEFTDKKIEVLTQRIKEDIASKGSDYWYKKATSSKARFSKRNKL